ncbi:6-bladed beta-propeller [Tangfeifania diversioriginum]|nr:6-bladed beta-propeller [Tangfeifania diversioriginum]
MPKENICSLDENISYLSNINSFSFIDRSHFVVSTSNPSSVIVYNTDGQQIRKIDYVGKGAFEFINPAIVKSYENNIYVWCSTTLRLLIFDMFGNPIKEFSNFKRAISNFCVYKNYICFYMSGGYKEKLIEVYDLTENRYLKSFVTPTDEHIILSMMSCSGGITMSGSNVIFMNASQLVVNSVDLYSFSQYSKEIKDKEFSTQTLGKDAIELINSNRKKAFNYIYDNSLVTGIFSVSDDIILKTEIGKYDLNRNNMDVSERYDKFYVLDKKLNLKYTLKTKLSNNRCLYSSNENNLYSIKLINSGEDFHYVLSKLNY